MDLVADVPGEVSDGGGAEHGGGQEPLHHGAVYPCFRRRCAGWAPKAQFAARAYGARCRRLDCRRCGSASLASATSACPSRSRSRRRATTSSAIDTDAGRVERLGRGESDIEDVPSQRLGALGERFSATTDDAALGDCDAILICVPTPLAAEREPDLTYVRRLRRDDRGPVLREGPAGRARVDHLSGHDPRGAPAAARAGRARRSARTSISPTRPSASTPAAATTDRRDAEGGRRHDAGLHASAR